jgi:hypothetical protein
MTQWEIKFIIAAACVVVLICVVFVASIPAGIPGRPAGNTQTTATECGNFTLTDVGELTTFMAVLD